MTDRGALGALRDRVQSTGLEILGWILVPVGIVMMPAPGPGTLVLVGGLALLARRYTWAQRLLGPIETRAVAAAKFGVATWPRILFSALGVVWLVALGAVWVIGPDIGKHSVVGVRIGPELPGAGWGVAIGLWASAIAAAGLLVYSVVRWGRSMGSND